MCTADTANKTIFLFVPKERASAGHERRVTDACIRPLVDLDYYFAVIVPVPFRPRIRGYLYPMTQVSPCMIKNAGKHNVAPGVDLQIHDTPGGRPQCLLSSKKRRICDAFGKALLSTVTSCAMFLPTLVRRKFPCPWIFVDPVVHVCSALDSSCRRLRRNEDVPSSGVAGKNAGKYGLGLTLSLLYSQKHFGGFLKVSGRTLMPSFA